MRKMRAAQITLLAILFSSCTFVAQADPTPTPSPVPSTATDLYKAAMEQFKKDRDAFNIAMKDRNQKIRDINLAFDQSIKKARQDSRTAMQVAAKPEQKSAINSNLRSAIATAVITRESALQSLGAPPVPPIEPMRPEKGAATKKDNGGKKNRN